MVCLCGPFQAYPAVRYASLHPIVTAHTVQHAGGLSGKSKEVTRDKVKGVDVRALLTKQEQVQEQGRASSALDVCSLITVCILVTNFGKPRRCTKKGSHVTSTKYYKKKKV